MKIKLLTLILCIVFQDYLSSQVQFNRSNLFNIPKDIHSTIPIGIKDINNDHLDDLILLDKGRFLNVFYQSKNNAFADKKELGMVSNNVQFSMLAIDLDNDGIDEILCGGYYDGLKIYKAFPGSNTYLNFYTSPKDFFTQNIACADINQDGLLDILVNDDDGTPFVFIQNENTSFIHESDIIDFSSTPASDNSGNYGSIWTDFDDDGDLDLYISKCRIGVDDPADPRRINQLFIQDQGGQFTESAALYNLANGEQTWVTDFADLDNDGDKDIIMINHTGKNLVLENIGNQEYQEIEMDSIFRIPSEGIQLITRDFDNDGLLDLFVSGEKSLISWNKGNFNFQTDDQIFDGWNARSASSGDLNADGFWDLFASFPEGLTKANEYYRDGIFENVGNANNFLKISIQCEDSNRAGIGTQVKLFVGSQTMLREIRAGDSYGIMESSDIIFGLGDRTSFDSLQIRWPNGALVTLNNLEINQHYMINDHSCIRKIQEIGLSKNFVCSDESISLEAPEAAEYLWSNGAVEQVIEITNSGWYNVQLSDLEGCQWNLPSVFIQEGANEDQYDIIFQDLLPAYCPGDSVHVEFQSPFLHTWSNGSVYPSTLIEAYDSVVISVQDCGESNIDLTLPAFLPLDDLFIQGDTIDPGEVAALIATGGDASWFKSEDHAISFFEGNVLEIEDINSDTSFYVEVSKDSSSIIEFAPFMEPMENAYAPDQVNGGLVFRVKEFGTILNSFVCFAEESGIRKFELRDYWGNVLFEKQSMLDSGANLVMLNWNIPPSPYYLFTTNSQTNINEFGKRSPGLKRSKFFDAVYPLTFGSENIEFLNSNGAPTDFYYFYNTIFTEMNIACTSERQEVKVVVNQPNSVQDPINHQISINPNPAFNEIYIKHHLLGKVEMKLFDLNGRLIKSDSVSHFHTLSITDLERGTYIIKIFNDNNHFSQKLIKI